MSMVSLTVFDVQLYIEALHGFTILQGRNLSIIWQPYTSHFYTKIHRDAEAKTKEPSPHLEEDDETELDRSSPLSLLCFGFPEEIANTFKYDLQKYHGQQFSYQLSKKIYVQYKE